MSYKLRLMFEEDDDLDLLLDKRDEPEIFLPTEVKEELGGGEIDNTNETLALYEPADTKRKGRKVSTKDDDTLTRSIVDGASVAVAGPSRTLTNELAEVRAIRAAERRMVAALAPSSRLAHVRLKRKAETGRYLMPGAPARKRHPRNSSPARGPRIYLPGVEMPDEEVGLVEPSYRPATSDPRAAASAGLSTSASTSAWEPRAGPSSAEPRAGPSSWEPRVGPSSSEPRAGPSASEPLAGSSSSEPRARPAWEPQPGPSGASPGGPSRKPRAGPSWELSAEIRPIELEIIDFGEGTPPHTPDADTVPNSSSLDSDPGLLPELEVAAEVEIPNNPVVPATGRTIGVHDPNCESTIDWLVESDDELNDPYNEYDDTDVDRRTARSALTEPALTTDYSTFELDVLDREDRLNDEALRSLAPESAYDFSWQADEAIFQGQPETFTGTPGPTFSMTDQTSRLDVFHKMVDVEFVDMLVNETNRYARQKIDKLVREDKLTRHSRLRQWTPTDRNEMFTFLAVLILQGLYPLPDEEHYFKFNGYGTMPYFRTIMSYDRFFLLKTMLHFTDNDTADRTSKLWKIDKVTEYFNKKFSSLYFPSREIVVDESLLKWHGRLSIAQKISSKAAQVGVKTYELCESSTGYLWKVIVYAGKQTQGTDSQTDGIDRPTTRTPTLTREDIDDQDEASQDILLTTGRTDEMRPGNATALIVYKLVEPLLYLGHTLIMDNFYNSPLLARCLKRQKTDVYGTLRLNREFVPDSLRTLSKTDLRNGEVMTSYCSDVAVMAWRDSNLVGMISTYHRFRIGASQKSRLTYKPSIVLEYNKYMGGVDRKDQFLSAHPMERSRNRVWYKKLFRRLYNAALFNVFIIYGTRNPTVQHRQFRTLLAEDLLRTYRRLDLTTMSMPMMRRPTRPTGPPAVGCHFPERTGSRKTRCFLCTRLQKHKQQRTPWRCTECQVNLCIPDCFKNFHGSPR